MTLSEYLELWLDTYIRPKRAANTARAYSFALAHLSPEIRSTPIGELSAILLQREVNQLAAVYSRQAQLMYIALRAALGRAAKMRMIERSPMELVDPPEHEKSDIETLSPEEAAAYLAACAKYPAGPLLTLMLCLGLRRNEARAVKHGDMDSAGILHIRQQRTREGLSPLKSRASRRDLPVPVGLQWIFSGTKNEFVVDISETALRRQHLSILAEIQIDRRVTLHGLRHTCATEAIRDGVQLPTVQRMLGHAHFQVTADTYIHPDMRILARCTNVIYGSFFDHSIQRGARLEIV